MSTTDDEEVEFSDVIATCSDGFSSAMCNCSGICAEWFRTSERSCGLRWPAGSRDRVEKYALDPTVKVEKTGAPLPVNGSWSVGKKAPAACPELTSGCVQVFYSVPEDDVLCSWTVMLSSDGLTGIVIGQNDAATRFLMRKLSAQDAVEVVAEKNLPVYPAIAVAANVQGDVVLRAVIAEDGTMTSLSVVSGPEMLRYAAEQAARDWKFKPLLVGQRSVRYQVSLTFSFRKFGPASSARVTSLP